MLPPSYSATENTLVALAAVSLLSLSGIGTFALGKRLYTAIPLSDSGRSRSAAWDCVRSFTARSCGKGARRASTWMAADSGLSWLILTRTRHFESVSKSRPCARRRHTRTRSELSEARAPCNTGRIACRQSCPWRCYSQFRRWYRHRDGLCRFLQSRHGSNSCRCDARDTASPRRRGSADIRRPFEDESSVVELGRGIHLCRRRGLVLLLGHHVQNLSGYPTACHRG